jgi:protein-S-isoprenylcysteine O-methyltransferase Ste14
MLDLIFDAMRNPTTGNIVAIAGVMLAYIAFALPLVFRRRPKTAQTQSRTAKRDPVSFLGILLQGVAFAIVFFGPVKIQTPIVIDQSTAIDALPAVLLAFSALVLFWSAFRALGANWSFVARVLDDHGLITSGPFALVRNPIYLAMFMMLLAADLALGRELRLLVAIPIFFIGTLIRVVREERLLRAQFGEAYDAYAAKVSRLIPGIW